MDNIRKEYDIEYGFLTLCNEKLPKEYKEITFIANNLPKLIEDKSLRKYVDDLQLVSSLNDLSDKQIKLLYKYSVMIINSYIRCEKPYAKSIPYNLSYLAWHCSNKLGLVPILTHAAVDLYNWNFINESSDDKFNINNIQIVNTITGLKTEEWFYTIMISIEGYGNEIINNIIKMCLDMNNEKIIKSCLENILKIQKIISNLVLHTYDHCNANEFYNILRIYLNGCTNKDIFPEGLEYEKITKNCNFRGGSASQSSFINLLDTIFGLNKNNSELKELRQYMPIKHIKFIEYVNEKFLNFRDLVEKYGLTEDYNNCIDELVVFRKNHMKLVQTHIIKQSNKTDEKGTAGTELIKFLEPIIIETQNSKI